MSNKRRTTGSGNKSRRTGSIPVPRQPAPAQEAEEYERLVARYPEDREELLTEAAGAWCVAKEYDRALALYDRLLDPADGACERPDLVDALRIGALWDAGREERAREAAAAFRGRHPRDAGAWNLVGEAFESHGDDASAAEWYTAGVTHVLGAGTPVTADAVEVSADRFDLEMMVIGRHRVRRLLGAPHDDWDDLADDVHLRRQAGLSGEVRPLDEAHDPIRLRRIRNGDSEPLSAEIKELVAAREDDRAARTGILKTCVLYWPPEEFTKLLRSWPGAAEGYGDDHAGHLRQVERTLRELSDQGGVRLAVGRATLSGLEAHARAGGGSPGTSATRSAYAAELARGGEVADWPPPRNGPCWCGSERKYKKCCGSPTFV
ncbi:MULTISPECIES: SEC-C domain-containing protein [unclassified Streptomyces]|uniref:SEC-C domain-containing protein n=1 Tax=unclassified Streptomyces TaxID=2593676 RepID=UPI001F03D046|nr:MULTISPECIES: SEC-C domain-containing protein [unclassified Streptomyces]MCH0562582.1 SEC-C domain-containing protein [Streptomyces sp. MUM 2J]MCH0567908.1 SEC-C domain-containing protein [Streptomyces sp. MUM 136J]